MLAIKLNKHLLNRLRYAVQELIQKYLGNSRKSKTTPILRLYGPSILVAFLYMAYMILFYDYADIFQFDYDEGNNLAKAQLLKKGFALYRDIWSDQPPVFTYLLWGIFSLFGWEVYVARTLVLLFSGIIVFVTYDSLRQTVNGKSNNSAQHLAAVSGCLALIYSSYYLKLSVSVMIGLPSISLMMLGAWALIQYQRTSVKGWLLGAGTFVALSIGTKLFTIFLIPVFGVSLLVWGYGKHRSLFKFDSWHSTTIFFAGFVIISLIIFTPFDLPKAFDSLLNTHLSARSSFHGVADGAKKLSRFFLDDAFLYSLTAIGAVVTTLKRDSKMLLWLLWFLSATIALYDHVPIWPHHRLLLTVPGAILAGFAVGTFISFIHPYIKIPTLAVWITWCVAIVAMGVLIFADSNSPTSLSSKVRKKTKIELEIQHEINRYQKDIHYVIASKQIHAFYLSKPVPPNLAVTSRKRFINKFLSFEDIASDIKKYSPEMIIITRRWKKDIRRAIREEIKAEYRLEYRNDYHKTELWVLKSIKKRK